MDRYDEPLDKRLEEALAGETLPLSIRQKIKRTVCLFLCTTASEGSGVVLAGYGEDDLFPCLVAYEIRGILFSRQLQMTRTDVGTSRSPLWRQDSSLWSSGNGAQVSCGG